MNAGQRVAWAAERLSARDWRIIEAVYGLRLVSGNQLERLYFYPLSGHARSVVRGRVLRRLVAWKLLTVLPRRIGGTARGSSGAVLALGVVGKQLCAARQLATGTPAPVRHAEVPGTWLVHHTLAVSELYVGLAEQVGAQSIQLVTFAAEPGSWWPNGLGGFMKPDAYACLGFGNVREHWWFEVDLGTESLPTLKRKLMTYLNFVERGQIGPGGLIPRVLITVTTPDRCAALRTLISQFPSPAADLFVAIVDREAVPYLVRGVQE